MKTYFIIFIYLFLILNSIKAQEINLQFCYDKAISNSPYQKLKPLYNAIAENEISLSKKVYLPQFTIEGSASYQSEVFSIPINFPGFSLPQIPYDQYQLNLTISQTIFDGGASSANIDKALANKQVNIKNIDVNLSRLKEQVNQMYFSILLLQESERILEIVLEDLQNKAKQLESLVKNGVIVKTVLEKVKIEIMKLKQNIIGVQNDKKGVVASLSKFIDYDLSQASFRVPELPNHQYNDSLYRQEFEYIELKKRELETSKNLISTQLLPKVFAFAKGGWGQPNPTNMFETGFEPYYIFGLKFQWTPFDWNSTSLKKENIFVNQQLLQVEKENLEKNIKITLEKDISDYNKFFELLNTDEMIIKSQTQIVEIVFSQLQNGTITATDYITEMNELTKAKLNYEMHKLQLIFARINLLNKQGLY